MADVTQRMLQPLKSKGAVPATKQCGRLSTLDLKCAAKQYITLWCKAIAEDKVEEFNTVFGCAVSGAADRKESADAEDSDHSSGEEAYAGEDVGSSDESAVAAQSESAVAT